MKNSQKGFIIPFVWGIVVLLVIGLGSYIYLNQKVKTPMPINQVGNSIATTTPNTNNEITISTTTSTKVPVTISIFPCDDQGTCFGSVAVKGKTIKNITLWYPATKETLDRVGIQILNQNGKYSYFEADANFGNHIPTVRESSEMENIILSNFLNQTNTNSTFTSEKNSGDISYKMVSTPNNNGSYPQIINYSDKVVMSKVNKFLDDKFKDFGCAPGSSQNTWNVGINVDYSKNNIFSVHEGGDYYCGGPYPGVFSYSFIFDMKTGEQVTFDKLFKNYQNDKTQILNTIYASDISKTDDYIKNHPDIVFGDPNSTSCDNVNTLERISSYDQYYKISSTTKSITAYPDYPHVIQGCGPIEEVPIEKLSSFISTDSILNRI